LDKKNARAKMTILKYISLFLTYISTWQKIWFQHDKTMKLPSWRYKSHKKRGKRTEKRWLQWWCYEI